MRVTTKGQVTIPQEIREFMGILPHSEVVFVIKDEQVIIQKAKAGQTRGQQLLQQMRGQATVNMTTAEIMALTRGREEKS